MSLRPTSCLSSLSPLLVLRDGGGGGGGGDGGGGSSSNEGGDDVAVDGNRYRSRYFSVNAAADAAAAAADADACFLAFRRRISTDFAKVVRMVLINVSLVV